MIPAEPKRLASSAQVNPCTHLPEPSMLTRIRCQMSTSTDPRLQVKPRVPKTYTDEQLSFLHSHLLEFERWTQGADRGDAKKFALEWAGDFIQKFSLPDDYEVLPGVDVEVRFHEVSHSSVSIGRLLCSYGLSANLQLIQEHCWTGKEEIQGLTSADRKSVV